MSLVDRAVWYIETHLSEELQLDGIAQVVGSSKFHLARTFQLVTGRSVMRYARARRLSVAAERLARGERDILGLALSLGYGSHQAFTRAFRDAFDAAPREVRDAGSTSALRLQPPLELRGESSKPMRPRLHREAALHLVGLSRPMDLESTAAIPGQWRELRSTLGDPWRERGPRAFGALHEGGGDGLRYFCGVEAGSACGVGSLRSLRVPPSRYAIFQHEDHVSSIGSTWRRIFDGWLPESSLELTDSPLLEVHRETFDPDSGRGGLDLWVPVRRRDDGASEGSASKRIQFT